MRMYDLNAHEQTTAWRTSGRARRDFLGLTLPHHRCYTPNLNTAVHTWPCRVNRRAVDEQAHRTAATKHCHAAGSARNSIVTD